MREPTLAARLYEIQLFLKENPIAVEYGWVEALQRAREAADRLDAVERPEVCICAAVRAKDGTVFYCHRHGYGMPMAGRHNKSKGDQEYAIEQGFVTSYGRFVGRIEARKLQDAAGVKSVADGGYRGKTLFSEDLY